MALTDGLVVEHDCSDFIDSVGSSNASDTSPVGSATTVESIDDRVAWKYSTTHSELTLVNPPSLAGDWTIAMWFKGLRASGYRTATKGSDHQIIIEQNTDKLGSWSSAFVDSGFTMPSANYQDWNHIVAVGSGATTDFYINGSFVGSIAYKSSDQITNVGNTYGYGQGFAEYIDDFKVWNRDLSSDEVMELYTGPFYQHPEDDTSLDPTSESSGWATVGQNNIGGGNFAWYTISPGDDGYLVASPMTPYAVNLEQTKTYNMPFSHNYARVKLFYYYIHDVPSVNIYADGQLVYTVSAQDRQATSISGSPFSWSSQFVADIDIIFPHSASTLDLKVVAGSASGHRRAAFSPVEIYVDNPDYATGFAERTYAASILAADSIMCFKNGTVLSSEQFSHVDGSLTLDNNLDISIDDKLIIVKAK